MLYRPATGNMWDTSIVFHDGRYYLFSMYQEGDGSPVADPDPFGESRHVWCAVSDDGVVWTDVGAVIHDQQHPVWKMFVRRLGDRFVMNYGSLSGKPGHNNDTLYFWESDDLLNWRPFDGLGESHPDPRWYAPEGRWDHMYMLPDEVSGGYVGYCVATPHERYPYLSCGLLHSADGGSWQILPPPVVEWGAEPAPAQFEVGGCELVDGKYYLIGGTIGYVAGHGPGYGVYTLVSDHWNGPFRPDAEAYRLCGSTGSPGVLGTQWLASFARGKDDELLITNYLTDNTEPVFVSGLSQGWVWFLPIKKAVIDEAGHLRMGYWPENERLKGTPIAPGTAVTVFAERDTDVLVQGEGTIRLDPDGGRPNESWRDDRHVVAVLETSLDLDRGVVIEGTLTIEASGPGRPSKAGFFFEESETAGTYLLLEAGDPLRRESDIGVIDWAASLRIEPRDVTRPGAATVTGISDRTEHRFRVYYRLGMFEVYVDDLLMQTFTTTGKPSGRFGFIVQNAPCTFGDVRIWQMSIPARAG